VAKIEAPAGYANVRAHAMLHKAYMIKQAPGAPVMAKAKQRV